MKKEEKAQPADTKIKAKFDIACEETIFFCIYVLIKIACQ